jgi:hypothetical protein
LPISKAWSTRQVYPEPAEYQKLIDLYFLDCAKKREKLTMKIEA